MGNAPAEREAGEREAALLREQLERADAVVDLRVRAVGVERTADLLAALADEEPAVVHLAGAGGELALERGPITPEALGALFGRAASIECVLLNAYFDFERADALLARVRCVVGVPRDGERARDFWIGFYSALAGGEGYAAAFERGRAAAAAAGASAEWIP